jgi:acyl-CoA thioester hydrolase
MGWTHTLHLRFADLDYLGHVTAAAYLAHFEEARAAWLCETWDIELPVYVVARQELEYLREVRLPDGPLTFDISVVRIGTASFDVAETLATRTGEVKNRSAATLVTWDIPTRRPRPLSPAERGALEAQLVPSRTVTP